MADNTSRSGVHQATGSPVYLRNTRILAMLMTFFAAMTANAAIHHTDGRLVQETPQSNILRDLGTHTASHYLHQEAIKAYKEGHHAYAANTWRVIAQQGHAPAQYHLGTLYFNGEGVKQDLKQALAWYQKAASQGHSKAQYNMGVIFAKGIGVEVDFNEAVIWWRKAALSGNTDAQFNLGLMYSNGFGANRDLVTAARWWQKAANQGDPAAQFSLGIAYANGHGVQQNWEVAEVLWKQSADQGYDAAVKALKILHNTAKASN
ncbi:MAG: hypothetical protein BMS9Abin36_1508 [Gammaproteobacteria bacterium]|nr:MAG: hypothetical protein BMS9Abin36_1508 [Gammaproteobacteria bacterium]